MKKIFFAVSIMIFLALYSISSFSGGEFMSEFRMRHSSSVFDPLEFFSLALVATSFTLLFFNNAIFNLWRKKFMNWFAILSLVLILSGADNFSYAWPTHTSWAMLLGSTMVIVTLLFAFISRFYFKIR